MISNEETTSIQLAVQARDAKALHSLVEPHSAPSLTELQLFGNHTLLMYVCEYGSLEMLEVLLGKGVSTFELEWSDNNEIKSVLRNESDREILLPKVLEMIPSDLRADMINTTWDPDPDGQEGLKSPLEMAKELSEPDCLNVLLAHLSKLQ